jgi:cell division protein FtsI (penicillin-binding protein 3)
VELLHRWMEMVTESDGTGAAAAMPEYSVAGKTGTAQMVDPVTKKYSSKLVTSSFLGYAPTTRPRLAAIFVFREPRHADYGGTLAAPVFRNVISASLAYLGVPPDKESTKQEPPVLSAEKSAPVRPREADLNGVPDFRGLTIREVLKKAAELSLTVDIVGSGVAVRQSSELPPTRMTVYFDPQPAKERT